MLGLVEEKLHGECRGAILRVKSGQGPSSFMRRLLQRLFPLEVRQKDNTERCTCETEKDHSTGNTPPIVLQNKRVLSLWSNLLSIIEFFRIFSPLG